MLLMVGELDEFEALPLDNQLEMILHYMRETYFYCFWYVPNARMTDINLGAVVLMTMQRTWQRTVLG